MNGNIKFHKPESPAFHAGEEWFCSGNGKVYIDRVNRYDSSMKFGADVHYHWFDSNGSRINCKKNVWSFQVRYTHKADLNIKNKFL